VSLRIAYRVRQFWQALGFHAESVDARMWEEHLNPAQRWLFQGMAIAEQRHSLAVLHTLQADGHSEQALLQAALLHDMGKAGAQVQLGHRVVTVLMRSLALALLTRLARNEPGSWRYPFFVQLHHAERGADLAAGAGTHALAVALIRWHHTAPNKSELDPQGQELLAWLQAADEQN